MKILNIVQDRYVQATGAVLAFVFVIWFVTDFNTSNDVAANVNTSDVINEAHKVSTSVDNEPMEVIIEGKAPSNDDNGSNNAGEI